VLLPFAFHILSFVITQLSPFYAVQLTKKWGHLKPLNIIKLHYWSHSMFYPKIVKLFSRRDNSRSYKSTENRDMSLCYMLNALRRISVIIYQQKPLRLYTSYFLFWKAKSCLLISWGLSWRGWENLVLISQSHRILRMMFELKRVGESCFNFAVTSYITNEVWVEEGGRILF